MLAKPLEVHANEHYDDVYWACSLECRSIVDTSEKVGREPLSGGTYVFLSPCARQAVSYSCQNLQREKSDISIGAEQWMKARADHHDHSVVSTPAQRWPRSAGEYLVCHIDWRVILITLT